MYRHHKIKSCSQSVQDADAIIILEKHTSLMLSQKKWLGSLISLLSYHESEREEKYIVYEQNFSALRLYVPILYRLLKLYRLLFSLLVTSRSLYFFTMDATTCKATAGEQPYL